MLIFTMVYNGERENLIEWVNEMRVFLKHKNFETGVSESIQNGVHFIKIFCKDDDFNVKLHSLFNLYMSEVMYKVVIEEFFKERVGDFLSENYFFLKYEELQEVKEISRKILKNEEEIVDDDGFAYMNLKNNIVQKIKQCIEENKEMNIEGFMRFRMKDIEGDIELVIDKVVEHYMVDKEYNEFIKLLKYFVEIQESKMEEVNIIINSKGDYVLLDENRVDVSTQMTNEFSDTKYSGMVGMDDMLISGLITNCPKRVIIHHEENCINKEVLQTIKCVFEERVFICNNCKMCESESQNRRELVMDIEKKDK